MIDRIKELLGEDIVNEEIEMRRKQFIQSVEPERWQAFISGDTHKRDEYIKDLLSPFGDNY